MIQKGWIINMARNKYDVDEQLETPFDIRHLKRALVYVAKYKKEVALSLGLSVIAAVVSLIGPLITQYALDHTLPEKNMKQLVKQLRDIQIFKFKL
jgi:ATP-binding cassette subfamily B protein